MNNGYGVSSLAVASAITSIFGIILLREHLGSRSLSPRSAPVDEKDATREKHRKMAENIQSSQQGILIAKETSAAPKAEGMPYESRKNRRVTFVDDLMGAGENATRNIQNYWRLRSIQSVDGHFRVRFATLDDEGEGRIRVDDEGEDEMMADNGGTGKGEQGLLTEQLGDFGEAAAERKVAAFLNRPLVICTCGDACPLRTPEDTRVVRQIGRAHV